MSTQRSNIEAKVRYLQSELEALKDYFYVPETYQYLIEQLDAQQVLLKQMEVEEQFAAIESVTTDSDNPSVVSPRFAVEKESREKSYKVLPKSKKNLGL